MSDYLAMVAVETRKAWRSRLPLWVALGACGMPLGIGLLIGVARNPALAARLGLLSAKADMVNYASADWTGYLGTFSLFFAAGGLMLFSLVFSWTFGREFADRTVKDLLAVPVARSTILAAKYSVATVWSLALIVLMLALGLVLGAVVGLPGG